MCCRAGTPLTDASNPVLEAALREAAAEDGLQLAPQQLERMLQLQLACEQRIGVVIMGPSGSGKSTLWQVRRAHGAVLRTAASIDTGKGQSTCTRP